MAAEISFTCEGFELGVDGGKEPKRDGSKPGGKFSVLKRPFGKLLRNGTVLGVSLGSDLTTAE